MSKIKMFTLLLEILLIHLKRLIFWYMENVRKHSNMCRKGMTFSVNPLQVIHYAIMVVKSICLGRPLDCQVEKL